MEGHVKIWKFGKIIQKNDPFKSRATFEPVHHQLIKEECMKQTLQSGGTVSLPPVVHDPPRPVHKHCIWIVGNILLHCTLST